MCHSQSYERCWENSLLCELCESPSYQLCQLFSNVSRAEIPTSLPGKWKQANFVGRRGWMAGWEPSLGWESKYPFRSVLHPTCNGFLIFSSSWWNWKSSRRRAKQRCHLQSNKWMCKLPLDIVLKNLLTCRLRRIIRDEENDSQERVSAQLLVMKTLSVGGIIYPATVIHTQAIASHCIKIQCSLTFVLHESGIVGRVSEYRLMRWCDTSPTVHLR